MGQLESHLICTDLVAHPPGVDHPLRRAGGVGEVGAGPARHLVLAEDQLLGHPPAHRHVYAGLHLGPGLVPLHVLCGLEGSVAPRATLGQDGNLR